MGYFFTSESLKPEVMGTNLGPAELICPQLGSVLMTMGDWDVKKLVGVAVDDDVVIIPLCVSCASCWCVRIRGAGVTFVVGAETKIKVNVTGAPL